MLCAILAVVSPIPKPISKILQQGGDGEHSGLNKVLTVKDYFNKLD
jgi:hypothetical protein